jgi:acyl carrier protein
MSTPTPTFNTIASILEKDFRMSRAEIRPDAALADLGLDSLALMEFVFAVEDAFRLRIPEDRLDPREAGITLGRLCEVIDGMQAEPALALQRT